MKVIALFSGGLDSALAHAIMKRQNSIINKMKGISNRQKKQVTVRKEYQRDRFYNQQQRLLKEKQAKKGKVKTGTNPSPV